MRSFWSDPYLWIHLAGLAAVPILLEICLIGLATGDPFLPVGLEFLLIAIAGVAPVLWMQWQQPFCIFSLLVLSLKPTEMTIEQRQMLRLFKSQESRTLAVVTAGVLVLILWQLYQIAPTVIGAVALPLPWRSLGLLIAAIAFLGINLFVQVPVSVVRVMAATDAQLAAQEAYPVEQIPRNFTLLGLKVNQILPPMVAEPQPITVAAGGGDVAIAPTDADGWVEDIETPTAPNPSPATSAATSAPPSDLEQPASEQAVSGPPSSDVAEDLSEQVDQIDLVDPTDQIDLVDPLENITVPGPEAITEAPAIADEADAIAEASVTTTEPEVTSQVNLESEETSDSADSDAQSVDISSQEAAPDEEP